MKTLADELNARRVSDETIEVATRAYLSEIDDDRPPKEVGEVLRGSAVSEATLERVLLELEQSPAKRVELCLAVLSHCWEDAQNRPVILRTIEKTQSKLPAIESALLAMSVMYGMYLLFHGLPGKRPVEVKRVVKIGPGTYEIENTTTYDKPESPIGFFRGLFKQKT